MQEAGGGRRVDGEGTREAKAGGRGGGGHEDRGDARSKYFFVSLSVHMRSPRVCVPDRHTLSIRGSGSMSMPGQTTFTCTRRQSGESTKVEVRSLFSKVWYDGSRAFTYTDASIIVLNPSIQKVSLKIHDMWGADPAGWPLEGSPRPPPGLFWLTSISPGRLIIEPILGFFA